MNPLHWSSLKNLPALLAAETSDSSQQIERVQSMERNIGLPVRAGVILVLIYYLFFSAWLTEVVSVPEVVLESTRWFLVGYILINAGASILLILFRQISWGLMRWVVFTVSLIDGLFLALLTLVTGGFDSVLYWLFLGLIIRNAVSVPVATLQIALNLSVCGCYVFAGLLDVAIINLDTATLNVRSLFSLEMAAPGNVTEPFLLRIFVLLLMTACCYGVQVLFDRSMRIQEETREYLARQDQLQAAGRLAAEIAHQLKNPLAIINNAAFNLQSAAGKENAASARQIQIIREEVDRSDRILTQVMGYAQLAEGKVERVDVAEAIDQAIQQVFPAGVKFDVHLSQDIAAGLPRLVMQRNHLSEILVNLLQNAREAVNASGHIQISAHKTNPAAVLFTITDDGPGVAPDRRKIIFEPYHTTKAKGTGLGLTIVKHNVELYGGTVRLESELGKGARFILELPTKTVMKSVMKSVK